MSKVKQAVQCFNNGFNCSQAIFSTYSEQLGLDKETALKVSCPFGGGIARMSETCGAVTGAYMLIGLKYGKYLPEDNEAREKSYALVKEFTEKFNAIHGSISCRDLLKYDMKNPDDLKVIKENNLWNKLCPIFVSDAAQLIEELLELE
ncbi:MAG TPA: C-GCAxxG-C-C family protein [Mobilitalea sp.]|nr:C-GCAxxG-C-C family protein [Mobilitalea sp.]